MKKVILGEEEFINYRNLESGKFYSKQGGILIITQNIGIIHNYIKVGSFESL